MTAALIAGKGGSVVLPVWAEIANGELTIPQVSSQNDSNGAGSTPATGIVLLTYFYARLSGLRNNIFSQNGALATVAGTYAAIGIYSVDPITGNLTLIGITASTASLGGAFNLINRAFAAPVPIVAGQLYAAGELQVATTPASRLGATFMQTNFPAGALAAGRLVTGVVGALPASIAAASLGNNSGFGICYAIT